MIQIISLLITALVGTGLGWATSFYSGFCVTVGPEEDNRDRKEVFKTYKWSVKNDEAKIVPAVAVIGVLINVCLTKGTALFYNSEQLIVFISYLIAATCLAGVAYVDLKIFEIPPLYDIIIAICGVARLLCDLEHWYVYAIGAVTVSGLFLIIALFSRGRAMGGGDIKLTAALGLLIGWKQILLVMTVAALLGAVIHGIVMAVTKKEHLLAFGPYLAVAGVISMCVGDRVIDWYTRYIMHIIES
ncbi:MAG: A24 family peptidase [Lachnospiraceae bacterium]|nr:A24 family peptidase [Lachnospiraceae bacterium]